MIKHDVEMAKVLAKHNRESRNKTEKKTLSRQRISHLARCNIFHEQSAKTAAELSSPQSVQPTKQLAEYSQGTKRDATVAEISVSSKANKQCKPNNPKLRQRRAIQMPLINDSTASPTLLCTRELWAGHCVSNISMHTNTFVSTMSPSRKTNKMPPLSPHPLLTAGLVSMFIPTQNTGSQIPVMVYNHIYGDPYAYTPESSVIPFQPFDHKFPLTDDMVLGPVTVKQETTYVEPPQTNSTNATNSTSFANEPRRSSIDQEMATKTEDAATEAETNSSFYSSFLKTDSGSDDNQKSSSDKDSLARNRSKCLKWVRGQNTGMYTDEGASRYNAQGEYSRFAIQSKRKMEPPWMEQVSATPDLYYRYKVAPKDGNKIFQADKQFLENLHQSEQVNTQLAQLYIDLQQQGVAPALHMDEGLTSSGSSGEESYPIAHKKRRPYSKLAMIFEEDAPFPPTEPSKEISTPLNDPGSNKTALLEPALNKKNDTFSKSNSECQMTEGSSTTPHLIKPKESSYTGLSASHVLMSTCKSALLVTRLPILRDTEQSRVSDSLEQTVQN